jgi:hypothetical protein
MEGIFKGSGVKLTYGISSPLIFSNILASFLVSSLLTDERHEGVELGHERVPGSSSLLFRLEPSHNFRYLSKTIWYHQLIAAVEGSGSLMREVELVLMAKWMTRTTYSCRVSLWRANGAVGSIWLHHDWILERCFVGQPCLTPALSLSLSKFMYI